MTDQERTAIYMKYPWVEAYEALAQKLKELYGRLTPEQRNKGDYSQIVSIVKNAFKKAGVVYPIDEDFLKKWWGVEKSAAKKVVKEQIDPFTIFLFCNRNWGGRKREDLVKAILSSFELPVPGKLTFDGIPKYSGVNKVFHVGYDEETKKETQKLWEMFVSLFEDNWADTFVKNYNAVKDINDWGKTYLKLFWVQPSKFLPLDGTSTKFSRFKEYVGCDPKGLKDPAEYLKKCQELSVPTPGRPFENFVEFSKAAYEESESRKRSGGKSAKSKDSTVGNNTADKPTDSPTLSVADKIKKLDDVLYNAYKNWQDGSDDANKAKVFFRERQKIWFGAPGTGKSFTVNNLKSCIEKQGGSSFRTTFHPDYDYATFVGCYKPVPAEDNAKEITYKFVPQVFTDAYLAAWKSWISDVPKPVILVIEEINRGNCAQIFGQIFQLLDRFLDQDKLGFSEYPVTMDQDLHRYLKDSEIKDIPSVNKRELVLPPNFFIFATMNTSDQSLFPMDSAFKRRWDWEYVPIDCSGDPGEWKIQVGDKKYSWKAFLDKINEKILTKLKSPDKQLGERFVKADEHGWINQKTFVNKVMFYLVGDAFKDDSTIREIWEKGGGDTNAKPEIVFADFADKDKDPNDNLRKFFTGLEVVPS